MSVRPSVRTSVRTFPLWLALRPCWLATRPLQLALRPCWLALRPLQPALRPLQQALNPPSRPSDPYNRPSDPSSWPSDPLDREQVDQLNDGWTGGQMDGWMEFLPILQDFVPCWGRCPATF